MHVKKLQMADMFIMINVCVHVHIHGGLPSPPLDLGDIQITKMQ